MADKHEFEMMTTVPPIDRGKEPGWQGNITVHWLRGIAISRWLLSLGSLIALALVFLPWVTIKMEADCSVLTCGEIAYPLNPLSLYLTLFFSTHPQFARLIAFQDVMLIGAFAPGILCSIWIRGRIQTVGQRLGLVTFSLWTIFFTGSSAYATYRLVAVAIHRFARPFSGSWAPAIGLYLLVLALGLLWSGLLLAWREMLQSPTKRTPVSIQPQAPLAYLGAALVTGGMICWFIGYYGIYWLLPANCPPTPLFGSAQCNNRLSAQRGYELLFQGRVALMPFYNNVMEYSYWLLGIIVVFGGVALLFTLWMRQTTPAYVLWIIGWSACLMALTGISYWGMRHLAVIYPDEQWTNGVLVAMLGLLLAAVGLLLRWQASSSTVVSHREDG